eukprot:636124-Hanusia_phi.AAC.2
MLYNWWRYLDHKKDSDILSNVIRSPTSCVSRLPAVPNLPRSPRPPRAKLHSDAPHQPQGHEDEDASDRNSSLRTTGSVFITKR